MDTISYIVGFLAFPFYYVLQPGSQYYLPTYVGSAVTAIAIYMVMKRRGVSARSALQLVAPRRLLRHASTRLDIKLFFVGVYFLLLQVVLVGGTSILSVDGTVRVLNHVLDAPPAPIGPSYLVTAASMALVFLAVEFGYWFSHFMMHKIPALWEFHKVHHSAEVLTPLTEWRQHPLELMLFPVLMGGASCLVQGPMVWYFGTDAMIINPMTANLISMAFWYTILHLRHSELPFYATGVLGKLIQAPAHHQVHHSTNPRHFDKNLGYCLSIFDWMFGTLYVPKKGETFNFGLGHKDAPLETVVGSMLAPISRAFVIVMRKLRILPAQV